MLICSYLNVSGMIISAYGTVRKGHGEISQGASVRWISKGCVKEYIFNGHKTKSSSRSSVVIIMNSVVIFQMSWRHMVAHH